MSPKKVEVVLTQLPKGEELAELFVNGINAQSDLIPKHEVTKVAIALFIENETLLQQMHQLKTEIGAGYARHAPTEMGPTQRLLNGEDDV